MQMIPNSILLCHTMISLVNQNLKSVSHPCMHGSVSMVWPKTQTSLRQSCLVRGNTCVLSFCSLASTSQALLYDFQILLKHLVLLWTVNSHSDRSSPFVNLASITSGQYVTSDQL